jgi:hypothetical protein
MTHVQFGDVRDLTYGTLPIYMFDDRYAIQTIARQRQHLGRMLDDLFAWLDCDGAIIVHW